MYKIKDIIGREILDSRGNPTVECDIFLDKHIYGRSSVPSGASKGKYEALELRDGNTNRYHGKGVKISIKKIEEIKNKIINKVFNNITDFDNYLIELDGTENKSKLGANTTLALSLSFAKSVSIFNKIDFYEYLSKDKNFILPVPMINILNGGAHADNNIDFQEFMISPIGANSFSQSLEFAHEVFNAFRLNLKQLGLNTNIGDEGGFAPDIDSSKKAIELIIKSIEQTGLKSGEDIYISLDIAANEIYIDKKYQLKSENLNLTSSQMSSYLEDLVNSYPIYSIEDGMCEDDWDGWQNLSATLGKKIQLVGDDVFVTNEKIFTKGIKNNIANSILIKLNQIGTLSETLRVIDLAKNNDYSFIISHRSGETEDTSIADLSVATSSKQIKTGSITRSERTAKYNQLLRIENKEKNSKFAGKTILRY